ncbi:HAMP domain-containing protein [Motiliproteus sp. MSK22-1]|uniref:HAMP domain-containing protein n=1 Tax=Motiliproteus sp. MSK22-1 TaxID=1897630 RepID=UPI00097841DD|nr:HAMP domain-containing protein [Motiliproteus sp. MSK22-1]OMH33734.1 hypothetical protein BGP75_12100 [Motiliproteus sp. MSK22-1]
MHKRSDSLQPAVVRRFSVTSKLLTLLTLIAVCSGLILFDQLSRNLKQLNQSQLDTLGNSIAAQLALNSGPLILGRDWVSLNISLKQLTDDPQIQGAEITGNKGEMIAQAGQPIGQQYEHRIQSSSTSLGQLRLYLSDKPLQSASNKVIQNLGLILLACVGLSILAAWLFSRHLTSPIKALERAAMQIQEGLDINHLDDSRSDEFGSINHMLNQQFAYDEELDEQQASAEEDLEPEDDLQSEFEDSELPTRVENIQPVEPENDMVLQPQDPPFELDTEASREESKPFFPSPKANVAKPTLIDALSSTQNPDTAKTTTAYSADHEHDQTTAKLSYLLYINQKDSSSNALEPEERSNLLQIYRQIFEQACVLYKGHIYQDDQENWFALFRHLEGKNSVEPASAAITNNSDNNRSENSINHGISALCAAQLFKGLYRGLNQHRIHQFRPVLNLKMSLVCGSKEQAQMVAQAQQLSLSVETNELITDQRLYSMEPINSRMLANGQYKKANDSTYLVSSLSSDFQDLIDRQVEHFLHPQQENLDQ